MTALCEAVLAALSGWHERPLILGICGAQGSGKSTLASELTRHMNAAVLSLDDLYLAPERRPVEVHPLFATRGAPGTHDVALGARVLDALRSGARVRLPRFDKAADAPLPEDQWPEAEAPDIIIFEGWCVGAAPQPAADLTEPVNDLERMHDPDGVWRRHVYAQLAGPYRDLFARIDRLVFLQAPDFEVVHAWRCQQEHELRRKMIAEARPDTTMSDEKIAIFIQHYERLTRHLLRTLPDRADVVLRLDAGRRLIGQSR